MKLLFFFLSLVTSLAFSQNTISGTLSATKAQEFMIIGCLIDLSTQDCNYEKSQYAQANQDGSYILSNLEAGQYLIIAWRDTNANGNLEEEQDEVAYYTTADGQPGLVSPPASGIDMQVGAASNPPTQTPAQNPVNTPMNTDATTGVIAPEYVGVWADDTEYLVRNDASLTGSISSGNVGGRVLRIQADGSYSFYESDLIIKSCLQTIHHQGRIEIGAGTVTFYANERRETQKYLGTFSSSGCETYDRQVNPIPESRMIDSFDISESFYGWRTYVMVLSSPNELYWALNKVKGNSPPLPEAQALPSLFTVGQDVMYQELVGGWFVSDDSDFDPIEERTPVDFYNAATGQVSATKYASSLTLANDGSYEIITYRPNVLYAPICTKNALLVERGTTRFVVTTTDEYYNKYLAGDLVLTPTSSTLHDELINCEADDYKQTISLPLTPRYLTWRLEMFNTLSGAVSSEDRFSLHCPPNKEDRTEWLFMFCPESNQAYLGFKRK